MNDNRYLIYLLDLLQQTAGGIGGLALLRRPELSLNHLLMLEQRFDFLLQLMHRGIHLVGERLYQGNFVGSPAISFQTGHGFDAPHAGGNRAFTYDTEQTDLAG